MALLTSTLLIAALSTAPVGDEGRGTAAADAHLGQFQPGSYVFGERFVAEEHFGEVVLVVFGGS